jgi:peptide/nickel transport system permease protein
MGSYLIRRILLIIPTLFLVTVIIFFIIRLVPGDIVELMAAEMAEEATGEVNPEDIREMLGLDIPVHIQYVRWITAIITRGDLGKSLWTERSVTEDIINRFPVSFELGALALIISIVIALPVGFYSAIRQDSAGDYFGRIFAIGMLALPNFWLATMLFVFPSIWWNWSPPVKLIPFSEDPIGNLKQFLIPAFLMGTAMSATIMRMTRTMALEVLRQDYVRTAWSKGLKERVVVLRHVIKNAMIPVVTIIGLRLPVLIGGTVIMEQIFVLPGIGLFVVEAVNKRDYTVISGINLFLAVFVLLVNLIVDLSYSYLDPRVRNR